MIVLIISRIIKKTTIHTLIRGIEWRGVEVACFSENDGRLNELTMRFMYLGVM